MAPGPLRAVIRMELGERGRSVRGVPRADRMSALPILFGARRCDRGGHVSSDADQADLDAALRRCGRIARRRARNFYYGLKLAPEPKRSALYVLYAWMREADDIVDQHLGNDGQRVASRLLEFAERTCRALEGSWEKDGREHLWQGLRFLRERFGVAEQHFQSMIDGQLRDIEHGEFETFDDLRRYCEMVASSVGLLCVQIWGANDARAAILAIDRGIAFQLTNILRDYAEDDDLGRVYLPSEDFRRHAITPQVLRAWSEPARCGRFMDEQIARARSFYAQSRDLENMIEPDCRPVLEAMTMIYSSLLEKVAGDPERAISGHRVRLSPWRKFAIAARAARAARRLRGAAVAAHAPAAESRG